MSMQRRECQFRLKGGDDCKKEHGRGAEKRATESEFKERELLLGFQPMLSKIPLERVLETSGSEFADCSFQNWDLY